MNLIHSRIVSNFEWDKADAVMLSSVIISSENSIRHALEYMDLNLGYWYLQMERTHRNNVDRTLEIAPVYPIVRISRHDNLFFFRVKGIRNNSEKGISISDLDQTELQYTLGRCTVCPSWGRNILTTNDILDAVNHDINRIYDYKKITKSIIFLLRLQTLSEWVRSRFDDSKLGLLSAISILKSNLKMSNLKKRTYVDGAFSLIKKFTAILRRTFDHKENKHRQKVDTDFKSGKNFELRFIQDTKRSKVISKFFSKLKTTILNVYTWINLNLHMLELYIFSIGILWPITKQVWRE